MTSAVGRRTGGGMASLRRPRSSLVLPPRRAGSVAGCNSPVWRAEPDRIRQTRRDGLLGGRGSSIRGQGARDKKWRPDALTVQTLTILKPLSIPPPPPPHTPPA